MIQKLDKKAPLSVKLRHQKKIETNIFTIFPTIKIQKN